MFFKALSSIALKFSIVSCFISRLFTDCCPVRCISTFVLQIVDMIFVEDSHDHLETGLFLYGQDFLDAAYDNLEATASSSL